MYINRTVATWTMAREGRAAFLAERISGAQYFDIDEVADQGSPYPHMVSSETEFQEHVGKVCHNATSLTLLNILWLFSVTPSTHPILPFSTESSLPSDICSFPIAHTLYMYMYQNFFLMSRRAHFFPTSCLLYILLTHLTSPLSVCTPPNNNDVYVCCSWVWAVEIMLWCMIITVRE